MQHMYREDPTIHAESKSQKFAKNTRKEILQYEQDKSKQVFGTYEFCHALLTVLQIWTIGNSPLTTIL